MDQFILWFNMLTFALLVASAGLVYLVYLRSRHTWLRSFIIYTGAYAFWLLFGTYVRVAVSFVALLSGSLFFLILAGDRVGRIGTVVIVASAAVSVEDYGISWRPGAGIEMRSPAWRNTSTPGVS